MKRCRHCGYQERGVRFGERKFNIRPIIQHLDKAERNFKMLLALKNKIITSDGLESKGFVDLAEDLFNLTGHVTYEIHECQDYTERLFKH